MSSEAPIPVPVPSPVDPAAAAKKEPATPEILYAELVRNLQSYMREERLDVVQKAYQFASHYHRDQRRRSGEPYITHPLAVANILTSLRIDIASIVAAILHDTVEDTEATLEDIEREFGADVRDLVDGLTKISKIKFRSSQERLAENSARWCWRCRTTCASSWSSSPTACTICAPSTTCPSLNASVSPRKLSRFTPRWPTVSAFTASKARWKTCACAS